MSTFLTSARSGSVQNGAEARPKHLIVPASPRAWRDASRVADSLRTGGAVITLCDCSLSSVKSGNPGPETVFVVVSICKPHEASSTVELVRTRLPNSVVIAVTTLSPDGVHALMAAVTAGAREAALLGYDDLVSLATRVGRRALAQQTEAAVLARIGDSLTPEGQNLFRLATNAGSRIESAATLASRLGLSYRTLVRRFAAAQLPSPGVVIAWAHILMAAHLASMERCSTDKLAQIVGYSSSRGLRDVVRSYTSMSLADLMRPTAFELLACAFVSLVTGDRGSGRKAGCSPRHMLTNAHTLRSTVKGTTTKNATPKLMGSDARG